MTLDNFFTKLSSLIPKCIDEYMNSSVRHDDDKKIDPPVFWGTIDEIEEKDIKTLPGFTISLVTEPQESGYHQVMMHKGTLTIKIIVDDTKGTEFQQNYLYTAIEALSRGLCGKYKQPLGLLRVTAASISPVTIPSLESVVGVKRDFNIVIM